MPDFSKEDLEELKAWSKDPKGAPFWATIKEMFAEGVKHMRAAARRNDHHETVREAAHIETLEEVLDLPSIIIQDHARREEDAKV